jgi:pimeloyl-ACP methyl ester carboxylesterase
MTPPRPPPAPPASASGFVLAHDDVGAADGIGGVPPLLLLHAFPLSRRMWQPQMAALAGRCRLIAPDLPGFGGSSSASGTSAPGSSTGVIAGAGGGTLLATGTAALNSGARAAAEASGGSVTARAGGAGGSGILAPVAGRSDPEPPPAPAAACGMEAMAAATIRLLDARGVDRVVVCGLSMGGYVALALYAACRERVAGLVLAGTRATADDAEGRRRRLDAALAIESRGSAVLIETLVPRLVAPHGRGERTEMIAWLEREVDAAPAAGAAGAQRGMAERPDRTPLLAEIGVPTLVIAGAEDQITPPAEAAAMSEHIPGARLVTIAAAGHLSNLEQPAAFNRALLEFMAGFGAPAPPAAGGASA